MTVDQLLGKRVKPKLIAPYFPYQLEILYQLTIGLKTFNNEVRITQSFPPLAELFINTKSFIRPNVRLEP
jgi:hypothetical protein